MSRFAIETEPVDCYRTTSASVDAWRRLAGQDGIDAWCRLHNLDPNQTQSEMAITGGLVQGERWIKIADRRHPIPFSRTLIAPPPPVALELID